MLGADPKFDADEDSLSLTPSFLATPLPHADAELCRLHCDLADEELARLAGDRDRLRALRNDLRRRMHWGVVAALSMGQDTEAAPCTMSVTESASAGSIPVRPTSARMT